MEIFNAKQRRLEEIILKNNDRLLPLSALYHSEIQNLGKRWAFYSGQIEGNTYTYVETEALLTDGITSTKRYEDAKQLKNLYNTFIGVLETIKAEGKILIDDNLIFRLHSQLTESLISDEDRGRFRHRAVAITGTSYKPPKDPIEIGQKFSQILFEQEKIESPLQRSLFLHLNMARLQPFIDGNKRTGRILGAIVLMNANILPIYGDTGEDIIEYRKGIIDFYETGNYATYADYFLRKKLEQLQEMTSEILLPEDRGFRRRR